MVPSSRHKKPVNKSAKSGRFHIRHAGDCSRGVQADDVPKLPLERFAKHRVTLVLLVIRCSLIVTLAPNPMLFFRDLLY